MGRIHTIVLGCFLMATLTELKKQAKDQYQRGKGNQRLKGYSKMSKLQLETILGKGDRDKKSLDNIDKRAGSAAASVDASGKSKEIILQGIKQDIEDARKNNPNISQQELRKLAAKALGREVAILKGEKKREDFKSSKPEILPDKSKEKNKQVGVTKKKSKEKNDVQVKPAIQSSTPELLAKVNDVKTAIQQGEIASKTLNSKMLSAARRYMDFVPKDKIAKIQKDGTTTDQANALAAWLGSGYERMSRQLWDKKTKPDNGIMGANALAAQALHNLPAVTTSQLKKFAEEKGNVFDENKPLNRWLTIDPPDAFLAKYKAAVGKTIKEENFFGTSHLDGDRGDMALFASGATIEYKIKPKLNGKGQGRYVDHFKDGMNEGEVLYPPGSSFKVKDVRLDKSDGKKGKWIIELEEH